MVPSIVCLTNKNDCHVFTPFSLHLDLSYHLISNIIYYHDVEVVKAILPSFKRPKWLIRWNKRLHLIKLLHLWEKQTNKQTKINIAKLRVLMNLEIQEYKILNLDLDNRVMMVSLVLKKIGVFILRVCI